MDHVGLFHIDHFLIVVISLGDTARFRLGGAVGDICDGDNINVSKTAECLNVGGANETDADHASSESFQKNTP